MEEAIYWAVEKLFDEISFKVALEVDPTDEEQGMSLVADCMTVEEAHAVQGIELDLPAGAPTSHELPSVDTPPCTRHAAIEQNGEEPFVLPADGTPTPHMAAAPNVDEASELPTNGEPSPQAVLHVQPCVDVRQERAPLAAMPNHAG